MVGLAYTPTGDRVATATVVSDKRGNEDRQLVEYCASLVGNHLETFGA